MNKWLAGCGVGCVVILAVLGVVGYQAFRVVRDIGVEAENITRSNKELVAKFPPIADYTPPADPVDPARLAAFVAVRTSSAEARQATDAAIESFARNAATKPDSLRESLRLAADTKNMIQGLFRYLQARNEALLAHDMAPGEYIYLYTLTYHALLGKPLTAGPAVTSEGEAHDMMGGDQGDYSPERVAASYNRTVCTMLENLLASIAEDHPRRALFQQELAALREDTYRALFADGLPAELAAPFTPHREALEAAWSPGLNRFDLVSPEEERSTGFNINID